MMNDQSSEPTVGDLLSLRGKRALVTGASGYLGGAMARALAEAGAAVAVSSRDPKRAEAVAASLPPCDTAHQAIQLDHMDEASIDAGFALAAERMGGLDVLVNNGHEAVAADWTQVSAEQFTRQLANATGYFLLARRMREHAVARGAGASVIMLGSMYGLVGSYPDAYRDVCPPSPVAYHALKGGVVHLTRHLAVYWAGDRVRVNCLSPGPFPAPNAPAEMVRRLTEHSPMKRMGLPHELKGAVVFLASDASSYMTGQNLVIDGGWTAW
ncbi:MAG: SDR family oxidoreductase [Pirellulales bacterium]|jgi:gluconate 5-dehydrogenase|nr:SDR family oxidoreductase [Thermoguttaceae bacterium]MDD4785710.1 SDR family oxidoreductase [Pirellulales bacterium]